MTNSSRLAPLDIADRIREAQAPAKFTSRSSARARARAAAGAGAGGDEESVEGHTLHALQQAVALWEAARDCVLARERVLGELEAFERVASDPSRLYTRVSQSSRVAEAKQRGQLMAKLERASKRVVHAIGQVEAVLGDTVTFKQRPYRCGVRV